MKKVIFLFVFVSCAVVLRAQDSKPAVFTFNHLALSVTDLERSVKFYSTVLKLEEIRRPGTMEGIRWFSLGEDKELHLLAVLKEPVTTNKAVHIALTTTNFDLFVKELEKAKIEYSDWPGTKGKINIRADGVNQIFLQDPDGYWIEVNSAAKK